MVQTVKRLITKSRDPSLALLEYRNTEIDGVDMLPAQLFPGRRLKSIVPAALPLLESTMKDNVVTKLKQRQQKQQEHFNRHGLKKPLKSLKPGDNVIMTNATGQWTHGHVKDLHSTPTDLMLSRVEASATGETVNPCDQPESVITSSMRIVPKIFQYLPFHQLEYRNRKSNQNRHRQNLVLPRRV
jgi:hypothetical protein